VIVALATAVDRAGGTKPTPPSAVPCSATDFDNHHSPVVPSDAAVLEMRKICGLCNRSYRTDPDAPIVVACFVAGSIEQAAAYDVSKMFAVVASNSN